MNEPVPRMPRRRRPQRDPNKPPASVRINGVRVLNGRRPPFGTLPCPVVVPLPRTRPKPFDDSFKAQALRWFGVSCFVTATVVRFFTLAMWEDTKSFYNKMFRILGLEDFQEYLLGCLAKAKGIAWEIAYIFARKIIPEEDDPDETAFGPWGPNVQQVPKRRRSF